MSTVVGSWDDPAHRIPRSDCQKPMQDRSNRKESEMNENQAIKHESETADEVAEDLIEEVSIDGMCGVY